MSAHLQVDLTCFANNLAEVRRRISPAEHMLVVKNNAYGHGLEAIVRRATAEGVQWFGAFDVRTGRVVRQLAGPRARIFVWILATPRDVADAVEADLDIGVGSADLLEEVAQRGGCRRVHLKVDTGLHRNGVRPEEWPEFVRRAAELEEHGSIEVVGIWSHLAEASDAEDDRARDVFDSAVYEARAVGLRPSLLHLAASAASFARPQFRYDLVRVGAYAYGVRPSGGPTEVELGIVPVASLLASVTRAEDGRVTIDLGSLDGLPSSLGGVIRIASGSGEARVGQVGLLHSELTGPSGADVDNTVAIFGARALQSATDLAEAIDTIGEEILVRLSPSVERRYEDEHNHAS